MKRKLAVLDGDANYLERMHAAFDRKYSEEIEFSLFTSKASALEALEECEFDLLMVSNNLDVGAEEIPDSCLFVYLSDTRSTGDDHVTIFKFQRIDLLWTQLLQVMTEMPDAARGAKVTARPGKILLFCGTGGVGTSSAAAACAMRLARSGKVAYLNLEQLSCADLYFSCEDQKNLTDVISAMRDPQANLRVCLQDVFKEDSSGVSFLARTESPLDLRKLGTEGMLRLISELKATGAYDHIVLDMDFFPDEAVLSVCDLAETVIMVSDASRTSERKTNMAVEFLHMSGSEPLMERVFRLLNRVEEVRPREQSRQDIPVLGVIGVCVPDCVRSAGKERCIAETLADMDVFDRVL